MARTRGYHVINGFIIVLSILFFTQLHSYGMLTPAGFLGLIVGIILITQIPEDTSSLDQFISRYSKYRELNPDLWKQFINAENDTEKLNAFHSFIYVLPPDDTEYLQGLSELEYILKSKSSRADASTVKAESKNINIDTKFVHNGHPLPYDSDITAYNYF